jgi:tetratricopeptide (TPR) repeat protein
MWLKDRAKLLESQRVIIVESPLAYGVSHLVRSLEGLEKPLVWLDLTPLDKDDPISQGNKLSEAVNRAFDANLLSYGLPYAYTLNVLKSLHEVISPCTLALTQGQYAPELAGGLLELKPHCTVLLHFDSLPETFEVPQDAHLVTKEVLELTEEEALELSHKRVKKKTVLELLEKTNFAYDHFLAELHQHLKLPPHLLPGPTGLRMLPGYDVPTDPATLLKVLMKRKRWLEALELAARAMPERVPKVLEEAGHAYHEQGLHKRLFYLLENLPEDLKGEEGVLYWRLQAAFRLGLEGNLRKEVESYLKQNEAPELRALAAGVFVPTSRKEALRAYRAKKTPFTAFQLGRLTYGKRGIQLLEESIRLAEKSGRPYEVVRNGGYLAAQLIARGQFQEAMDWSEWSLKKFDQLGVQDGQRQLSLLNDWAFTRILLGKFAGLEQLLKDNEAQLESAYPDLARLFCSTLGNYLIATSRPSEALEYYQKNFDITPRSLKGYAALNIARAFLELGQPDEAIEIAKQTMSVMQSEPDIYRVPTILAIGISLAAQHPTKARAYLLEAQKLSSTLYTSYWSAQIGLYIALTYVSEGNINEAHNLLLNPNNHIVNLSLSGLRLLSGPESVFRPVWALLSKGKPASLELRFLGKKEVWLEGEALKLFPSWLEILAVLAIEQRPLELEELMSCLYGDGGNKITLKANLAKMRRTLPISQHPYHIQGSFQADFIDVAYYLKKGNLQEAIKLYGGPLLKFSVSPSIRAKDEELVESLCTYALEGTDIEALMRLSELLPDDLRLLDKLSSSLDKSDPRASNVRARVEQIKNSWLDVPATNKRLQKAGRQARSQ